MLIPALMLYSFVSGLFGWALYAQQGGRASAPDWTLSIPLLGIAGVLVCLSALWRMERRGLKREQPTPAEARPLPTQEAEPRWRELEWIIPEREELSLPWMNALPYRSPARSRPGCTQRESGSRPGLRAWCARRPRMDTPARPEQQ